jgi:hypothetical protein
VLGPVILVAAFRTGPPPRFTGGFGEETCQYCHWEFEMSSDTAVFHVAGLPDEYVPRQTYELDVIVTKDGLGASGFQLAIRFVEGESAGSSAGTLESTSARTSVEKDEKSGVAYAQHRLEGITPQAAGRATWRIRWTAPGGGGTVRLDAAANAGDGDKSEMGDRVYTFTRTSTAADAARSMDVRARAATFSALKPSSRMTTSPGADAPKRSSPTTSPAGPAIDSQPSIAPASTVTRAADSGGSTRSR